MSFESHIKGNVKVEQTEDNVKITFKGFYSQPLDLTGDFTIEYFVPSSKENIAITREGGTVCVFVEGKEQPESWIMHRRFVIGFEMTDSHPVVINLETVQDLRITDGVARVIKPTNKSEPTVDQADIIQNKICGSSLKDPQLYTMLKEGTLIDSPYVTYNASPLYIHSTEYQTSDIRILRRVTTGGHQIHTLQQKYVISKGLSQTVIWKDIPTVDSDTETKGI